MNTDIRISISFRSHRKRRKLMMSLNTPRSATDYLLDFWISVAMDRSSGVLSGLNETDIAMMAGWEGDPEVFVGAMVDVGFLEKTEKGYVVHEWDIHNGWASTASIRSAKARNAARVRWGQDPLPLKLNADAMQPHSECIATGDAPSPYPSPNPSPKPNPKPKKKGGDKYPADFQKFWDAYPRKIGKGAALKAWKKAHPPAMAVILNAIEDQKKSRQWMKDDGQYIPHPSTWINQERWEDEVGGGSDKEREKKLTSGVW